MINRRIVLAAYCDGPPAPANFRFEDARVASPESGEVLVRTVLLSMDPFPRLRMSAESRMGPPLPLNETVIGRGAGQVVQSADSEFEIGDWVAGELGWQTLACVPAAAVRKVDPDQAPLTAYLSALGAGGITAYLTLAEVGIAQAGETVLLSGAAGSVGGLAGQIAGILGCRVIGAAFGAEQCEHVARNAHFDAVLDCSNPAEFSSQLADICPDGVDLFLDGVGGAFHNAVLMSMKPRSRIIVYGYISGYNEGDAGESYGSVIELLRRRITLTGFLVGDYQDRFQAAASQIAAWLRDGSMQDHVHIEHGFESVPAAFARVFESAPAGKQLVQIGDTD